MDRRRWLQYERSQRAPDRCLFGAAPQRREEPAQRTSAFLSSREENGEDRCWSAALVWIGSVWQKRRPVITNLSAYRGRVSIDATSLRMVALGMATSRDNAIPRSSYLFGASWPNVCRTLLVAVEQDGDPYAVMVPTAEIIRFYYGPSTPSNSTARKQFERSGHRSCNTQLSWGAAPSILQQTTFNHS